MIYYVENFDIIQVCYLYKDISWYKDSPYLQMVYIKKIFDENLVRMSSKEFYDLLH